ncbi:amidohydrolase family protein [Leifsonia bigeumensis]|uniref:Amidohydrolase family protein n=1 Tax=Leifsonella bigeumensis TaxID=433643 RepID=A0ABP7FHA4_9MICO
MIVDCSVNYRGHPNLGLYDYLQIPRRDPKPWQLGDLIAELDANGIAMAGLIASVVADGVGGEIDPIGAEEIHPMLAAAPDRLFGWVGINPLTTMETVRYIDYAVRELGFKAVHVYPHWFGVPINDRLYYPIYAKCAELGVPIGLQVGTQSPRSGAKFSAHPLLLDDVAFDFPELKILGLHLGHPFLTEMLMLCKNHENVYVVADAHPPAHWGSEVLDYILQKYWSNKDGARKVIWGTDYPVQGFAESLRQLRDLELPAETLDLVAGGNARRVFGLDEVPAPTDQEETHA